MAKYKKARFIAFNIKPGTRDEAGTVVYLGPKSADLDIQKRCAIMKNAMVGAYEELAKLVPKPPPKVIARGAMNVVNANPVLTIFMAPEFFFRGADGAYPIEKISSIMPELARTAQDPKFKDWLFVYGTAVGYQKIDEAITKIAFTNVQNSTTVIVPDSLAESNFVGWHVVQYVKAGVEKVRVEGGDQYLLFLDTDQDLGWCDAVVLVHGPEAVRTEEFRILARGVDNGKAVITIRQRSTPIRAGWTAELSATPRTVQQVIYDGVQVPFEADVTKVSRDADGTVRLTLAATKGPGAGWGVSFTREDKSETQTYPIRESGNDEGNTTITINGPNQRRAKRCPSQSCECEDFVAHPNHPDKCGNCTHSHIADAIQVGWTARLNCRLLQLNDSGMQYVEGRFLRLTGDPNNASTEVFNIALVQRGGAGAREILVYKQSYSGVDFLPVIDRATKQETGKYKIHGKERWLVNTEQLARGRAGKESDISGAAVFDIEGCTIGLEICLDHREGRLDKYYAGPESGGGKPKPQVLLIPSWRMTIGGGPVCCQKNGLAFNVDGSRGDSVLRIIDGTYGCDDHPRNTPPGPGDCADCEKFFCQACGKVVGAPDRTAAGGCPACKGKLGEMYMCPDHDGLYALAGPCPVLLDPNDPSSECGKSLVRYARKYQPIGHCLSPAAGPTEVKIYTTDWRAIVSQKNYFLSRGELVIYPEQAIPNA